MTSLTQCFALVSCAKTPNNAYDLLRAYMNWVYMLINVQRNFDTYCITIKKSNVSVIINAKQYSYTSKNINTHIIKKNQSCLF